MVDRRNLLKRGAGALAAAGIGVGAEMTPAAASVDPFQTSDPKHVVLIILDRSGSMTSVRESVVESMNKFLDEQADKTRIFIGLVQFDDYKTKDNTYCEPIFGFTDAKSTPRLAPNDYQPRGNTPLLAAVAEGISKLEQVIGPKDRALMVFQTDGLENASPREITKTVIKELIKSKEAEGNWTFAFMGADIDAWGEGGSLGVHGGSTMTYANTGSGTNVAYRTLSTSTTSWYATTAGGMSAAVMDTAAANTNSNFFAVDTETTATAEPTTTAEPPKPEGKSKKKAKPKS